MALLQRSAVAAQNSFESCADAVDRPSTLLVARVSTDCDALNVPDIEGVREHHDLCLGVHGGALGARIEPCATNFDFIRVNPAERPLGIHESCATDKPRVVSALENSALNERSGPIVGRIVEQVRDVAEGLVVPVRNLRVPVKRAFARAGIDNFIEVMCAERFEYNVLPSECADSEFPHDLAVLLIEAVIRSMIRTTGDPE